MSIEVLPDTPPTVRQVVRWIAQLGGFLGRKGDGEPGITTVWRGWSRLIGIAEVYRLRTATKNTGNNQIWCGLRVNVQHGGS